MTTMTRTQEDRLFYTSAVIPQSMQFLFGQYESALKNAVQGLLAALSGNSEPYPELVSVLNKAYLLQTLPKIQILYNIFIRVCLEKYLKNNY